MTNLSVNINKVATIRNARGGNMPNVLKVAQDCELFGAQGITVHPRPDERHIRYSDVYGLKPLIRTEFNIEGYPCDKFIDLVLEGKTDPSHTGSGRSGCHHVELRLERKGQFRLLKRIGRHLYLTRNPYIHLRRNRLGEYRTSGENRYGPY